MRSKLVFFCVFLFSCNNDYTPKPRAFYKINLPEKKYDVIDSDCSFIFEIPLYSKLLNKDATCFYDLDFPQQNAVLHITYLPLRDNLIEHTEESRKLAYKHDLMADGIIEKVFINDSLNVYGILYDYEGVTATALQFYLTDSLNHFFRGALYFDTEVSDSLLPVNNFLKLDVKHIIESFRWISH